LYARMMQYFHHATQWALRSNWPHSAEHLLQVRNQRNPHCRFKCFSSHLTSQKRSFRLFKYL
jgi:hypothetical protein